MKQSRDSITDTLAEPRREGVRLQVLIATMGAGGIRSVAAYPHPRMEGVEYLVGWQMPEGEIPDALRRSDFRILPHHTRGLSRNRNFLLDHATAPVSLISDDDISYTEEGLRTVIEAFDRNPGADILTFRYETGKYRKEYPDGGFDLSSPPKGYYLTSFELAFRTHPVAGTGVRFNEHFGLGSRCFISGEEILFLHDLLGKGLRGRHIPEIICIHPDEPTTGRRPSDLSLHLAAKGAVVARLHPFTWPLRMVIHLMRSKEIPKLEFLRIWTEGVVRARRLDVWRDRSTHTFIDSIHSHGRKEV